jgi:MFS family permease
MTMSDQIVEPPGSHEPSEYRKTPKKAAASGWIGSALEYYDFFIYAQAAALVFPTIFFPSTNPQVGIVASFATFGVGYVARPIGAFVLGHWGDTHGRKNVLVLCMLMMGLSTFLVALLPTYDSIGIAAPILLVALRLIQGFAVGGEISGSSAMIVEHAPFGRRGYYGSYTLQGVQAGQIIAAAVFLPLSAILPAEAFQSWGWRIPFLLSALVVVAGYIIRRRVDETPAFQEESAHGAVPKAPIVQAVQENGRDMLRVICMALMNAIPTAVTVFGATFATAAGYGVGLTTTNYLWISVVGNIIAVVLIPFVGNLTDRIGRRPVIIVGCLGSGILAFPYLYFVAQANLVMAFLFAMLMWGCVYQGYNAVFPAFYQELFPTKTRVTAFAVSQNIGTLITAFLPTIYASLVGPTTGACVVNKKFAPDTVLPSGETCRQAADAIESDVVWTVGSITLGLAVVAAIAAWSSRETYRIHLNDLGLRDAQPIPKDEYDRLRRVSTSTPA